MLLDRFIEKTLEHRKIVHVVGDYLWDHYHQVSVNRISPEFPIPIYLSKSYHPDKVLPGGSGNVCRQFEHFPFDVCNFNLLMVNPKCQIPIKHRIYQDEFPLTRWDVESPNYGLDDLELQEAQEKMWFEMLYAEKPDVTIYADYGKGAFNGDKCWIRNDCITIVDPKCFPLRDRWYGCTIFKPNQSEAANLSGYSDWRAQCEYFQKVLSCESVVITQGGQGVVGRCQNREFEYTLSEYVEPTHYQGAGDCFAAFLGMAVAHGFEVPDAAEIAYRAGALYVSQREHQSPLTPLQLCPGKVIDPRHLENSPEKIVFTNGCFDILHVGHLKVLEEAKKLGGLLIVGVNSNDSVRRLKGPDRPVNSLEHRCRMLAALEYVDGIVVFEEDTPLDLIRMIRPYKIVKGGDYAQQDVVGTEIVGRENVHIIPLLEGHSTTKILDTLA